MKKTYITPEIEVMNIETVEMIAASSLATSDETIKSSDALGNERRGAWGNLWN